MVAIARIEQGLLRRVQHLRVRSGRRSPEADSVRAKRPWTPAADADFAEVGWRPEGNVYFDYEVQSPEMPGCAGCFTVTAYGDVDADPDLALVQFVQPTADLANHLTSILEPASDIPLNSAGTPIFMSVSANQAADNF